MPAILVASKMKSGLPKPVHSAAPILHVPPARAGPQPCYLKLGSKVEVSKTTYPSQIPLKSQALQEPAGEGLPLRKSGSVENGFDTQVRGGVRRGTVGRAGARLPGGRWTAGGGRAGPLGLAGLSCARRGGRPGWVWPAPEALGSRRDPGQGGRGHQGAKTVQQPWKWQVLPAESSASGRQGLLRRPAVCRVCRDLSLPRKGLRPPWARCPRAGRRTSGKGVRELQSTGSRRLDDGLPLPVPRPQGRQALC